MPGRSCPAPPFSFRQALDTYGSQAVGAGNFGALGSMFKQARALGGGCMWLLVQAGRPSWPIQAEGRLCFRQPAAARQAVRGPASRGLGPCTLPCLEQSLQPRLAVRSPARSPQAVLWLMLHTIPIGGLFFTLPALLKRAGQEPELADMSGSYLMALFPAIWIDAIYRWVGGLTGWVL